MPKINGEINTLKGVETSARFDEDEVISNSYDDNDTGESEIVEKY